MDCIHARPIKLFTAALMLKMSDINQKRLTAAVRADVAGLFDVRVSIEAVMPEKKVAMVDRFAILPIE